MLAVIAVAALTAVEVVLLRQVVGDLDAEASATAGLVLFGLATAARRTLTSASRQGQLYVARLVERAALNKVLHIAAIAPFEQFEDPDFQDRMKRALDGARTRLWQVVMGAIAVLTGALSAASLILVIATLASGILLILAMAAIALAAAATFKSRMTYRLFVEETQPDRERAYLRAAITSPSEGKELRLFGTSQRLLDRHDSNFALRIEALKVVAKKRAAADLVANLVLAGALVTALIFVARSNVPIADAAAIAIAAQQLTSIMLSLSNSATGLIESSLVLNDLESFTSDQACSPQARPGVEAIRFEDVSFRYPNTAVDSLSRVSFTLDRGEIVAVVGANGSGKTTLAKLLAGLYCPTSGTVSTLSAGRWSPVSEPLVGQVTALFQDFARYELPLRDNVTISVTQDNDDEAVACVLERVGVSVDARRLEDGLESRLGRRFTDGVNLSGGEWQRVALARCLYSSAPFVILDEPSAAVDARGEAELFGTVRELAPDRGVLLISHRFATVRNADRIIVLDEGHVVESGTHEQLMEQGGPYRSLFTTQQELLMGGE